MRVNERVFFISHFFSAGHLAMGHRSFSEFFGVFFLYKWNQIWFRECLRVGSIFDSWFARAMRAPSR